MTHIDGRTFDQNHKLSTHPRDANIQLLRPQRDSDEAAWEVSLLPLQQVFALVQGDVQQSHSLPRLPGGFELQCHLQLPHGEVVAKVVGDGGDGAERVRGDGAVQLGQAGRVQFPAHQLQVAQVPEHIRGVTQGQAGLTAGGGRSPPVVVRSHSLQGDEEN